MKHSIICLLGALACLAGGEAQAVPIDFKFKGEVTSTFFDPVDPFAGSIGLGTPFVGFYTFESTTPDAIADPSVGSYSNFGAPFGMSVNIGGVSFVTGEFLNIGVANDIGPGVDQYTVLGQEGTPLVDPISLSIEIFLEDPAGTASNSDALPLTPPELSSFARRDFFLDGIRTVGNDIFQFQIQGTLTALALPEPSTGLLLTIGLAGMGFMRPGQQQRRQSKA